MFRGSSSGCCHQTILADCPGPPVSPTTVSSNNVCGREGPVCDLSSGLGKDESPGLVSPPGPDLAGMCVTIAGEVRGSGSEEQSMSQLITAGGKDTFPQALR